MTPIGSHWLHFSPEKVRIWYVFLDEEAPLGQLPPTTVTAPATSWTGVMAPTLAVVIGSGTPGVLTVEPVAFEAVRIAATEDLAKDTWRTWLVTGCGLAGEETCGKPGPRGPPANPWGRAKPPPPQTRKPRLEACRGWGGVSLGRFLLFIPFG